MTTLDLNALGSLQEIHRRLASGFHISENDLPLWQNLTSEQPAYEALFTALGYTLVADSRGFFYFSGGDNTPYMGKNARRFALAIYALVELFADAGRDPVAALFDEVLDRSHATELMTRHKSLFESLEILTPQELEEQVLRRLVRFGFARETGSGVQLLAPAHRFIDAALELGSDGSLPAAVSPLADANVLLGGADDADDDEVIHG